jgi:LmbE family N-acetylglucosaminyl deacetylase
MDISRVIRQVRPQIVVMQCPERNYARIYASHPDHLAAAEATICAVYPDSRNPFTFTSLLDDEGLEAWTVPEVWMMAGPNPTHPSVITTQIDRKIAALMCHESQFTEPGRVESMVRQWAIDNAKRFDLPDGDGAELFQVIDTR